MKIFPVLSVTFFLMMLRFSSFEATTVENSEPSNLVLEVSLVCDKDFGDLFNHNRDAILDYWTVYFWDIQTRLLTLWNVTIQLRVTSVTTISQTIDQPFIEETRNEEGMADYNKMLEPFAKWMYRKLDTLSKFDIALLALSTATVNGGLGTNYKSSACLVNQEEQMFMGVGIIPIYLETDHPNVNLVAHSIGHILGASDDYHLPWCNRTGYILGNEAWKQFYFSWCADILIAEYAHSEEAACLKRIDEPGALPIEPGFKTVLAPSMTEQCKMYTGSPTAYVTYENTAKCDMTLCEIPEQGTRKNYRPLDNSPCLDTGRCFRGRCIQPGKLLVHVATGLCLIGSSRFSFSDTPRLQSCPSASHRLQEFSIWKSGNWSSLALPYSTREGLDNDDKCLTTGGGEGSVVIFDKCNATANEDGRHAWNKINLGNGEFLLSHDVHKKCMKPAGDVVRSYVGCDINDVSLRWKFQ